MWHLPNGKIHNQIDYILTPRRFKSSISKANARTLPGVDIGSDHDLVLAILKLKLKKIHHQKSPCIRFDIKKLKDPEIANNFEATIADRFAALNLLEEINVLTNNVKGVVQETVREVLGKERKKIQPWITNDILDLRDTRRNTKKTKNS